MSRQFIVVEVYMYRDSERDGQDGYRVCRIEGGYVNCR